MPEREFRMSGVQHYFPASLIGNFSDSKTGPVVSGACQLPAAASTRSCPLRAQECGTMPHHPHIYGDPDSPLDALFFMAETRMDGLMEGLDRVKQTEFAPAGWFVQVAAPYVGQLLARHPHLEAPRPSDLTDAGSGINGLTERYALVWALMDRVMHNAVWSLAISSDGGWTTSDAGCVMLPGRGSGSLLVPLTPEGSSPAAWCTG